MPADLGVTHPIIELMDLCEQHYGYKEPMTVQDICDAFETLSDTVLGRKVKSNPKTIRPVLKFAERHGLLERPKPGHYKLTAKGRELAEKLRTQHAPSSRTQ